MTASRIAQLRQARGWSRLDLAALAGVTESTIIRAERTTPPALQARSLDKIAGALQVPVSELYAGALRDDDAVSSWAPASEVVPFSSSEPDVFFIQDLARELRSTVRRLRAVLKREPWKLPEPLPSLDNRPRWARVAVERWLESREQDRKRLTAATRVPASSR